MSTSGCTTVILNFQLKGASWGIGDSDIESSGTSKNVHVDTEILLLYIMETDIHWNVL